MSAEIVCTLRCDTEGCPSVITAKDVANIHQLRAVAHREHGWSTRHGDYCHEHTDKAPVGETGGAR
ncbi:MAG: hypothetical protein J2P25_14405 [Nocardiopsaceae bacterium]|nr:hypothetical protein [Nocardiopsaceae bacterium]